MSEESSQVEKLVTVYLKVRTAIRDKEDEHKAEMAELKEQYELLGDKLLKLCNGLNSDSIKTPAGTISRRITSSYWTSDWDSMYDFIQQHDAAHLLERRINNRAMQEFLEDNPDELPMGLQADKRYTVQVRKPNTK